MCVCVVIIIGLTGVVKRELIVRHTIVKPTAAWDLPRMSLSHGEMSFTPCSLVKLKISKILILADDDVKKSYINVRHMADEALDFAKNTLAADSQPSIVRKILKDKFSTNLISKDLINIKETLAGKMYNPKR